MYKKRANGNTCTLKGVFLTSKMIFTRNSLIFHAVDESSIVIKNIIDMKNND